MGRHLEVIASLLGSANLLLDHAGPIRDRADPVLDLTDDERHLVNPTWDLIQVVVRRVNPCWYRRHPVWDRRRPWRRIVDSSYPSQQFNCSLHRPTYQQLWFCWLWAKCERLLPRDLSVADDHTSKQPFPWRACFDRNLFASRFLGYLQRPFERFDLHSSHISPDLGFRLRDS